MATFNEIWKKCEDYFNQFCADYSYNGNKMFDEISNMITSENVNITDNDDDTLLMNVLNFTKINSKTFRVAKMLIEKGDNINHLNDYNPTPFINYIYQIYKFNAYFSVSLFVMLFNKDTNFNLTINDYNCIELIEKTDCIINKLFCYNALYNKGCPLELFEKSLPKERFEEFKNQIECYNNTSNLDTKDLKHVPKNVSYLTVMIENQQKNYNDDLLDVCCKLNNLKRNRERLEKELKSVDEQIKEFEVKKEQLENISIENDLKLYLKDQITKDLTIEELAQLIKEKANIQK